MIVHITSSFSYTVVPQPPSSREFYFDMTSFYGAKNGSFVDVFSFCLLDYLLDTALVIVVIAVAAY